MLAAPIPANEKQRQASLEKLDIMPHLSEERFDRITRVAAALYDAPIAMINLISAQEQWFKSCVGIEVGGHTDRSVSFCGHAILQNAPFVVENALEDERFRDNPLVTGDMNVRAYLGISLHSVDGTHPGSLCIIFREPRKFSANEISLLVDLAAWADIELNSTQLRASLEQHRADQDSLKAKLQQMETLNKLMVGRELKMAQLKAEIASLRAAQPKA